jgi:hypothetical protein
MDKEEKMIAPKKSCQECHQQDFLYQCPRCSFRSCSLACCQAHKKQTGCDGKRDRTVFMPMGRMDDSTINSDYHFLNDVLGEVESGKRLLRQVGETSSAEQAGQAKRQRRGQESADGDNEALPSHPLIQSAEASVAARLTLPGVAVQQPTTTKSPQQHVNPKWRQFQQQCSSRGVNLLLMPPGLERHKSNKSHLKKDVLYWTVEWRIHSPATTIAAAATTAFTTPTDAPKSMTSTSTHPPARVLLSKISEQTIVRNAIQQVESSKSIPSTSDGDDSVKDWSNYSLLLKRLPCPSHQPFYVEISDTATLASAIKDMTVIEYPTIEVVPVSRSAEFPLAIQDMSCEVVVPISGFVEVPLAIQEVRSEVVVPASGSAEVPLAMQDVSES